MRTITKYEINTINYEVVYQIVKEEGLGLPESPRQEFVTEFIFKDEFDAKQMANKLWIENVSEEERKSGWCFTYYSVKERKLL